MAIDMGVNDAFGKLLRSGMGANKTGAELEKERSLVVQARVWFCVSPPINNRNRLILPALLD
jgi:hypothetical protein